MPDRSHVAAATSARGRASLPRQIGGWRLEHLIARGDWFEVYQAAPAGCASARADYAIKLLRSERAEDHLAIEMLRKEACLAADLSHPHLATILAADVERSPHYVVMPLMAGATLRTLLKRRSRLLVPHALWIARQIAEAVGALQGRGWFHCDIKPENIHVAASGHATLLDLGLAQTEQSAATVAFAGTPNYAAPEWFSHALKAGPACDVYSLGVVLFEMLCGGLPRDLKSKDSQERSSCLAQRVRRLNPQLPTRVGRLISQLLSNEPLRRPSIDDLISWLMDVEIDVLHERIAA